MEKLQVGKPYKEGITQLQEGIKFDFVQSGGILEIVFNNPSTWEIWDFKKGKIQLGLLEKEGIIFFFIKFGRLNWMDTPYNVSLSKPFTFEDLSDENKGFALQIVVVDGGTGIVEVLRLLRMPHEMSMRFKELVEKQKVDPMKNYYDVLGVIYSRFSTDELVTMAETYSL